MTKRTLLAIATLTAGLTLAACGDDSGKPAPAPAAPTPGAPASSAAFSDTMQADAQKLIDEATQNVKDGKFDLAEKGLTQLEAMKPKMTADWQARVDHLRSALETAKKAEGLKDIR